MQPSTLFSVLYIMHSWQVSFLQEVILRYAVVIMFMGMIEYLRVVWDTNDVLKAQGAGGG